MVASLLIIAVSLVLLVYWFRYTCLLLLRNAESDALVRSDGHLLFHKVQEELDLNRENALDPLHQALNRDYAVLTYLLEHASPIEGLRSFERRLLTLDYRVMRVWYRMTRSAAPDHARRALDEMARVVEFLAFRMSERAAAQYQG
jgi:hypothetical protein